MDKASEEQNLAGQYLKLHKKLTKLLIKSNPFRITCPTCESSFCIYLIYGDANDEEHIRELVSGFCPECGVCIEGIRTKKKSGSKSNSVDERVRNKKRGD